MTDEFKMHMYGFVSTWLPVLWVFAVGACVGSLVNVLVYRLPKGLPVIVPSSRCPKCDTKLTFKENIPILGWLMLRGKCKFCKQSISPEYPIVETIVAVLFAGTYLLWYVAVPNREWLGLEWGAIKPEWAKNGVMETWPAFTALMVLLASLVAMTIVDLKTYTIPLVLTWVPVCVALVLCTRSMRSWSIGLGLATPRGRLATGSSLSQSPAGGGGSVRARALSLVWFLPTCSLRRARSGVALPTTRNGKPRPLPRRRPSESRQASQRS